jgi:predicted enzyme related to lactoylglutathione lyase
VSSDPVPSTPPTTGRPAVRFGKVVLDAPDPAGLAAFYADLLGWEVDPAASDEEWVTLRGPGGGTTLAFQLAPDLPAPTWPEGGVPQQLHVDLHVDAYDDAEARALALGARLLDAAEEHPRFRVYADPVGHPFCLCLHPEEA